MDQDTIKDIEYYKAIIASYAEELKQLDEEKNYIFRELNITPEELKQALTDPKLFSKEVRNFLQRKQNELDSILSKRLEAIEKQAQALKKTDREIPQKNWLFVK